jgi:uncharacterized protein YndB with AHSA1/START domain
VTEQREARMMGEERGFTLTRKVNAPRAQVFQAWTEPGHLLWFFNGRMPASGPIEVDLRVGGVWRQTMTVDARTSYVTGGMYREVSPPGHLAFYWGASGGWPSLDSAHPERSPLATLTFNEVGGQTELLFGLQLPEGLPDEAVRDWFATGMQDGWSQTLDRLVARFA